LKLGKTSRIVIEGSDKEKGRKGERKKRERERKIGEREREKGRKGEK
jgi:hypothetical protein